MHEVMFNYFIISLFFFYFMMAHSLNLFLKLFCPAGLIVPDLPFEESTTLRKEALKKNIDMVGSHDLKFIVLQTLLKFLTA